MIAPDRSTARGVLIDALLGGAIGGVAAVVATNQPRVHNRELDFVAYVIFVPAGALLGALAGALIGSQGGS